MQTCSQNHRWSKQYIIVSLMKCNEVYTRSLLLIYKLLFEDNNGKINNSRQQHCILYIFWLRIYTVVKHFKMTCVCPMIDCILFALNIVYYTRRCIYIQQWIYVSHGILLSLLVMIRFDEHSRNKISLSFEFESLIMTIWRYVKLIWFDFGIFKYEN